MNQPPATTNWIAGYDGLRGIACLAVFGVHMQQITAKQGTEWSAAAERALGNGNTGVALFFMMSAFLLSQPLWAGKPLRLGRFVVRRAVRIVPAYYLCLTALVLMGKAGGLRDIAGHYLFAHNYAEATIYGVSDQFWTIAVQMQFYVVLLGLLIVLKPVGRKRIVGAAVLMLLSVCAYTAHVAFARWSDGAGASALPAFIKPASSGYVITHSLLAHLPHFLLGMAAGGVFAILRDRRQLRDQTPTGSTATTGSWLCDAICILCAGGIVAILVTPLDDRFSMPFGRYNWPFVPGMIAVLLVCTPLTVGFRRVLDFAPLKILGVISYGIYVYHLTCQNVTRSLMPKLGMDVGEHWIAFTLISLVVSIAVAAGSYWIIERPLLRIASGKKVTDGASATSENAHPPAL